MKRLTTSEVAQRLDAPHPTVKLWCRQGKFPNATLEETPRGPVWLIPESDLANFTKPTRGRPPKPKEEDKASMSVKKRGSKK